MKKTINLNYETLELKTKIMNEVNQYYGIIFKHRFIRHIQKELEKAKVE